MKKYKLKVIKNHIIKSNEYNFIKKEHNNLFIQVGSRIIYNLVHLLMDGCGFIPFLYPIFEYYRN